MGEAIGIVAKRALIMAMTDDVATVIDSVAAGEAVSVRTKSGEVVDELVAREDIPRFHKICLRALASGDLARKYGEVIGIMTDDVERGGNRMRIDDEKALHRAQPHFLRELDHVVLGADNAVRPRVFQPFQPLFILAHALRHIDVHVELFFPFLRGDRTEREDIGFEHKYGRHRTFQRGERFSVAPGGGDDGIG